MNLIEPMKNHHKLLIGLGIWCIVYYAFYFLNEFHHRGHLDELYSVLPSFVQEMMINILGEKMYP